MKTLLRVSTTLLLTSMISLTAFAEDIVTPIPTVEKVLTGQQLRMRNCNKDATGKKGDERKKFMSACLSGKATNVTTEPSGATPMASPVVIEDKGKICEKQAVEKKLKGASYDKYMGECTKK